MLVRELKALDKLRGRIQIAVGPSGCVYVATHYVTRFDANGVLLGSWGKQGNGVGEFTSVSGLAVGVFSDYHTNISVALGQLPLHAQRLCSEYTDDNERVYITDDKTNRVQAFTANGQFLHVCGTGRRGRNEGDVNQPGHCAVDPEDNCLYVADFNNMRVQIFSRDGAFLQQWALEERPRALAIGGGQLWVTHGRRVGLVGFPLRSNDKKEVQKSMPLSHPYMVAVDEAMGLLYMAYSACIRVFRVDGSFLRGYDVVARRSNKEGKISDPFLRPYALAHCAKSGLLYVCDAEVEVEVEVEGKRSVRILALDIRTAIAADLTTHIENHENHENLCFERQWKATTRPYHMAAPQGAAISTSGSLLYVLHSDPPYILCFDARTGAFRNAWGSQGGLDGQLDSPGGVAVGICLAECQAISTAMCDVPICAMMPPGLVALCVAYACNDRIYVCDTHNHRLQAFRDGGEFIFKKGSSGEFMSPYMCALSLNGNRIAIVDGWSENKGWHSRVQLFSVWAGRFLREWRCHELGRINDITMGAQDSVWIAEGNVNRILRLSDTDNPREESSCFAPYPSDTHWFGGVVWDDITGLLYVCDTSRGCIHAFRPNGIYVGTFGTFGGKTKGSDDGEFIYPCSLALSQDGILYVIDSLAHRVVTFSPRRLLHIPTRTF